MTLQRNLGAFLVLLLVFPLMLRAESGYDAWLRYARIEENVARSRYEKFPTAVVTLGDSAVIEPASDELARGVLGMLDRELRRESPLPDADAVVLGTVGQLQNVVPSLGKLPDLADDGYIEAANHDGHTHIVIAGAN